MAAWKCGATARSSVWSWARLLQPGPRLATSHRTREWVSRLQARPAPAPLYSTGSSKLAIILWNTMVTTSWSQLTEPGLSSASLASSVTRSPSQCGQLSHARQNTRNSSHHWRQGGLLLSLHPPEAASLVTARVGRKRQQRPNMRLITGSWGQK